MGNPNDRSALVGLFLLWREAQGQPPHLQRELWKEVEPLLGELDGPTRARFLRLVNRDCGAGALIFHAVESVCPVEHVRIATAEFQAAQFGRLGFCPRCGAAYTPVVEQLASMTAGGRES